jgi:hypothetical protein
MLSGVAVCGVFDCVIRVTFFTGVVIGFFCTGLVATGCFFATAGALVTELVPVLCIRGM